MGNKRCECCEKELNDVFGATHYCSNCYLHICLYKNKINALQSKMRYSYKKITRLEEEIERLKLLIK